MKRVEFNKLRILIEEKKFRELKQKLEKINKIDVASFIEGAGVYALHIFRMLSNETAARVFAYLSVRMQRAIINTITEREISCLIEHLYIKDTVNLLRKMPAEALKKVLYSAAPERKKLISEFLNYPKNSVGSIMSAEFIELKKDMRVKEALDVIQKNGDLTVYACFVANEDHIPEGVISFNALLLSKDETLIEDLMDIDFLYAEIMQNKKSAVKLITKYGLPAIPVIDGQNRIAGILTVDDTVRVIRQANFMAWLKRHLRLQKYSYPKTLKQAQDLKIRQPL